MADELFGEWCSPLHSDMILFSIIRSSRASSFFFKDSYYLRCESNRSIVAY